MFVVFTASGRNLKGPLQVLADPIILHQLEHLG